MLKSLYGHDLNQCRKWAEDAVGQHPNNLSARYALALCYLKKQQTVNALATIGSLLKVSPPLCPTQRLIGAAVLNKANGHELAKKWLPSEHKSLLIGPEKDLFNKILKEIELVNLETDQ
jgi:Tfp pilus assembly protein PilF